MLIGWERVNLSHTMQLKSNWLTGKLRKDNETKWLTGTEKVTMF